MSNDPAHIAQNYVLFHNVKLQHYYTVSKKVTP